MDASVDQTELSSLNWPFFIVLSLMIVAGIVLSMAAQSSSPAGWTQHRFLVLLGGDKVVGAGDIYHDKINAVCALQIALREEWRGQKLGSVASRMMLRRCFEELGARRVQSSAISTNKASLKMSDRMIEEGVLRERYLVRGDRVDEHLFRLLRSEWDQQNEAKRQNAIG